MWVFVGSSETRQFSSSPPVSIDKLKERALSFYKEGNYEQAISTFSRVAKALATYKRIDSKRYIAT